MTKIQRTVKRLTALHGGIRAAARAIDIDHAYLHHLLRGTKSDPSDEVLARLGLERRIIYREIKGSRQHA